MSPPGRDLAVRPDQRQPQSPGPGARRGTSPAVLSLQHLAGNRAVARLVGDADSARVVADPKLRGGWTEADGTKTLSGRVGGVKRILLDGLGGRQGGARWGTQTRARKGHAAAVGQGEAGHRGRAVALVPSGMPRDGGPITVVVHLHGIDVGRYAGSSGMREQGSRPEDVKYFQLPQQLESFADKHPDARVVVLMPLGATVRAGKGSTVDFGIDDWDTFVDESLAKLGITAEGDPPGSVFLSAHSGGGFTISALGADPFEKYRFGGVFGFESIHGDLSAWIKLAERQLGRDLKQLKKLRRDTPADRLAAKQLAYLRKSGFRLATFGGLSGYARRVTALGKAIDAWFAENHKKVTAATDGNPAVLEQLMRNYRSTVTSDRPLGPGEDRHMAALSQDSHFETALESTVAGAPAVKPAAKPARSKPAPPDPAPATPAPAPAAPVDKKQQARDEHKDEPPKAVKKPAKKKARAKGEPKEKPKYPSLQEPFRFRPYTLQKTPIVLVKGDDEHSQAHAAAVKEAEKAGKAAPRAGRKPDMTGAPADFMVEILRRAKVPNPDTFFDRFVSGVSFLGRNINAPIHERLAEHLRGVEKELADKHGGPDKDPAVAGDTLDLGTEDHAGARQASGTAAISMHMFGLAIDVNHYRNPYLQAKRGMPTAVFRSVSQLMEGKSGGIDLGGSTEDAMAKYTRLHAHNQMLIDYFALAQPANQAALEKKLEQAAGPWKKRDVKEARKQIEADLAELGVHTARRSDLEMLRTKGYLQLREEVVRAMKMNWGAWYGDMMHFDLRTDGDVGQRISEQIVRYLAELRSAQAKAAAEAQKAAAAPRP